MHAPAGSIALTDPLPLWKRVLDILCCILALPFLALSALWAALITTVASPGPIIFRQERIGHLGRRFYLYKFRTMHMQASTSAHEQHMAHLLRSNVPMQKLDARGDQRLIPGGWVLRATGLDELPQIINILRGEMTIVGPRPGMAYEFEQLTPAEAQRVVSVPGLTGLWQVSGKNNTTFEQMIQLDIAYGEKRSLRADLSIIARTVPVLIRQVIDTRKQRRASSSTNSGGGESSGTAELKGAVSATFLSGSQNVVMVEGADCGRPGFKSRAPTNPLLPAH